MPPDRSAPTVRDVYEEHARFVWLTLQRLGVHPADVADLAQDVFLIVHRRLDTFTGVSRMTTWLFGICMRVAANHRRLRHHSAEISIGFPGQDDPSDDLSPEERLIRRDERAAAEAILNRLSPAKRAVFLMFEVEAIPGAEIAASMGITLNTVYSRLHAARREIEAMVARNQSTEGL